MAKSTCGDRGKLFRQRTGVSDRTIYLAHLHYRNKKAVGPPYGPMIPAGLSCPRFYFVLRVYLGIGRVTDTSFALFLFLLFSMAGRFMGLVAEWEEAYYTRGYHCLEREMDGSQPWDLGGDGVEARFSLVYIPPAERLVHVSCTDSIMIGKKVPVDLSQSDAPLRADCIWPMRYLVGGHPTIHIYTHRRLPLLDSKAV